MTAVPDCPVEVRDPCWTNDFEIEAFETKASEIKVFEIKVEAPWCRPGKQKQARQSSREAANAKACWQAGEDHPGGGRGARSQRG